MGGSDLKHAAAPGGIEPLSWSCCRRIIPRHGYLCDIGPRVIAYHIVVIPWWNMTILYNFVCWEFITPGIWEWLFFQNGEPWASQAIDIWSVGCIYVATSIVKAFKNQLCYFNVPTEAELLGMLEGTRTQARSDVQITLCFSGNFVFLLRSPQAIPSLGSALACLSLSIMPG